MEIGQLPLERFGTGVYFCVVLTWGVALAVVHESHKSLVGVSGSMEGPGGFVVFVVLELLELLELLGLLGPWDSIGTFGLLAPWAAFDPSVLPLAGSSVPWIG